MVQPAQLPQENQNAKGFYPTPRHIAEKMLSGIDWLMVDSILEPSAGKGDLAESVLWKLCSGPQRRTDLTSFDFVEESDGTRVRKTTLHPEKANLDCIEIDPNLRHILTGKKYRVVHDDFLSYRGKKRYDLIVMNPPFDRGDEHLLHALELLELHGGNVVCLLNAETLRNPHTNRRDLLRRRLEALGADIEYVADAFRDAERSAEVDVAIVKAIVPKPERPSVIMEQLRKEAEVPEYAAPTQTFVAKADFVQAIVDQYDFEVRLGMQLIEEYTAMQPHLLQRIPKEGEKFPPSPIMSLTMGSPHARNNDDATVNAFIQAVRSKYWEALFTDERFTKQLTSNLKDELHSRVEELRDYDFSVFNILELRAQMSSRMVSGVEKTILKLFDDCTSKYSYGEYSKNRYLYDGWKTNEAWRVGKKVVTPMYGRSPFSDWNGKYDPTNHHVRGHLGDIEKVLRYLDTGNTEPVDMVATLELAKAEQQTRKIKLTYFYVTFYKKGTIHIEFHDQAILHKFNLFGSQRKGWLPPTYGKKRYKDMSPDERKVVDSFEGETSYNAVMDRADFYLVEPTQLLLE